MTIDEFLERIEGRGLRFGRKTRRPYEFLRDEEDRCPITALCEAETGAHYSSSGFFAAGKKLGLTEEDCRVVADAADDVLSCPERRRVRERLLALVEE